MAFIRTAAVLILASVAFAGCDGHGHGHVSWGTSFYPQDDYYLVDITGTWDVAMLGNGFSCTGGPTTVEIWEGTLVISRIGNSRTYEGTFSDVVPGFPFVEVSGFFDGNEWSFSSAGSTIFFIGDLDFAFDDEADGAARVGPSACPNFLGEIVTTRL